MPVSMDYQGTIETNVKNVTLRIPLTVSYRRRTDAELAQEKVKAAENAEKRKVETEKRRAEADRIATTPDPAECRRLIDVIKAKNGQSDHRTIEELTRRAVIPELQDEVVELLKPYVNASHFPKLAAVQGIARWSNETHIPLLIELLEQNNADPFIAPSVIDALGRFNQPEVYQAIAATLGARQHNIGEKAKAALIAFGPGVEDAVIESLKSDPNRAVAGVLQQIGTEKSIKPLEEAELKTNDFFAKRELKAAREAIQRRIDAGVAPAAQPENKPTPSPASPKLPADGSRGAT